VEVRDPNENAYKIKLIYPRLFFRLCKKCRMEFRGTLMWTLKELDGWPEDAYRARYYICSECAPNYDDAVRFITGKDGTE
jgi:hypothetical protein